MSKVASLIMLFLCSFLLNTGVLFGKDYILYVRARDDLGDDLRTYFFAVRNDPDISHDAIRDYPPHCSLTGFFPKTLSKDDYIDAVNNAIQQLGNTPRTVHIDGLIQGNQNSKLDYIKLSSSYLLAVTQAFMSNASVPPQYLKNPQDFTYHITLRNHVFQRNVAKKIHKIHSLQRKIDLSDKVTWSLYLYERDDDHDLHKIKEFPL